MRALLLLVALMAAAPLSAAACELAKLEGNRGSVIKDCPPDVTAIIDRMYACWHWTGEEPYDKARQAEINQAISQLKCDKYPDDYKFVQAKYAKDAKVTRVMNEVIGANGIYF